MGESIVIPIDKWKAALGLVVLVFSILASVWGATALAIDSRVERTVREKVNTSGFVTATDMNNVRQLDMIELQAMDKRLSNIESDVQYLVRRELEKASNESPGGH